MRYSGGAIPESGAWPFKSNSADHGRSETPSERMSYQKQWMFCNGGVDNVLEDIGQQEDPSQCCLGSTYHSEQYLPGMTYGYCDATSAVNTHASLVAFPAYASNHASANSS
jgi:hypothetical protein